MLRNRNLALPSTQITGFYIMAQLLKFLSECRVRIKNYIRFIHILQMSKICFCFLSTSYTDVFDAKKSKIELKQDHRI